MGTHFKDNGREVQLQPFEIKPYIPITFGNGGAYVNLVGQLRRLGAKITDTQARGLYILLQTIENDHKFARSDLAITLLEEHFLRVNPTFDISKVKSAITYAFRNKHGR
jgi:hypothetical protein